jgi:DNA polymerase-3 subunit epsilon
MKYLSIDIESTGLAENCLMIEFAMVPFDATSGQIGENLAAHYMIHCPPYQKLAPTLDKWVQDHNQSLIEKAHREGIPLTQFRQEMKNWLESKPVRDYFGSEKIVLFGKSMNAIDLPFMNRDLGWDFMRQYFSHRVLDLSSACHALMDLGLLPPGSESGSTLMKYLGMGEVAHNAMEDALNTAKMYLKILKMIGLSRS